MKTGIKTNAMRILEGLGLPFEVLQYDISDETNEDIALYTSKQLGIAAEQVYKTIIMENSERNYFVFCLPAGFSISLKRVRELTGSSSIDLMKTDKLLGLTGYIRGGVSPLGMKRKFPTFISELAQLEEYIYISGGLRGVSLKVRPADLALACDGTFADFVQ
ncbi:MAG: aminoacyl-tRNA deacylase [Spirochaetales bacterium]|nr:aminoacyl-tRNA deacylase [Spirochaetales bacterium]